MHEKTASGENQGSGFLDYAAKAAHGSCYIQIHKDKVADASAHDKQMEDFMGAEVFMPGIKKREFQCINHAADGIYDASCQQPKECRVGKHAP